MRGVYCSNLILPGFGGGSSPRAWGILPSVSGFDPRTRFIPTCVGYTPLRRPRSSGRTVHPHVRGVYATCVACCRVAGRFIPTCVGYTVGKRAHSVVRWVHPHVRGVYGAFDGVGNIPGRFIPTCVGYTHRQEDPVCPNPVHPHVRGVYTSPEWRKSWISVHPHVRGVYVHLRV